VSAAASANSDDARSSSPWYSTEKERSKACGRRAPNVVKKRCGGLVFRGQRFDPLFRSRPWVELAGVELPGAGFSAGAPGHERLFEIDAIPRASVL